MAESIRVLHVDDEPDLADVTASFLEREDDSIEVVTETTPEEALARLEGERIDCIVSDFQMDGMDGLEFLEAVREDDEDLPFILFTGKGSEEIASEAISAGVTDYLQKETGTSQYAVLANRIRNVVEQVRSERSIEQSEAELRRKSRMLDVILQHVPVHIYIKDDEARHTWVSDYYMGSNEQLGKTDPEFFDQDWAEETYEEELAVIETGEPIIQQERYDPGRNMWVLNSKVPWEDEDSEVVGLVGATLDITERKQAQLELRRQKERLKKFIGVMSHDLRNPLDLAMGRLGLAQEEYDSEHLEKVADAHDRMRRIIDETLTLARQGQTAENLQSLSLSALAEDSWAGVDTGDATLDVDDVNVTATETGLRHLFENLFGNAVQHGGDDVTVRIGPLAESDGFFVEDDGEGIPEDRRDDVFDVGHTTDEDGIGFGLSIVEEVAQAHDWDIAVAESDDGGARFEFRGVDLAGDR